ncbi:MAG TPA: GNAT family N-acetyltransferase [Vicinamibacterales bacterium]|nr:GNAT family N-acetyltransferase [Vicinamibacterales bacterium]
MTNTLAVRAAGDADVPAITALVNAAFAVERAFVDRDRTSVDEIRSMMAKGGFFVADDRDGSLLAAMYLERRGDHAYLGMLSIQPAEQGRGVGRAMMTAAESQCRAWNCVALDIRILHLRTELPPFYLKLGFVETGRTDFVDDPLSRKPYYFILMTKPLQ